MKKKLKVFYTVLRDKNFIETLKILNKEYNWNPVLIQNSKNLNQNFKKEFPTAKFVEIMELRRLKVKFDDIKYFPIDAMILNKLAKYMPNFISFAAEDPTGNDFSYLDRREYFYKILNYWNTMIKNYKPDLFVSQTVPHDASNYVLYLLAKYIYNIPVLFIDEIFHFDSGLLNIGTSVEDISEPIYNEYKLSSNNKISPIVEEYLSKMRSERVSPPKQVEEFWTLHKKVKFKTKFFIDFLKHTIKFKLFSDSNLAYGNSKRKDFFKNTFLNHFYLNYKSYNEFKKLQKEYEKISAQEIKDEKFIYYPAPFQPESISNVRVGFYEDPFLILEMIQKAIPNDYFIYYKEHPAMWMVYNPKKLGFRDKRFYQKLSSFKKVKIISSRISTFDLIDKSKAVATASASTGWEGVIRNKPVLTFGKPWYSKCNGVFEIESMQDLENSMKEILDDYKPNIEKVNSYAQSIYNISYLLPHIQPLEKTFKDDSYRTLAKAFDESLKKNYRYFYENRYQ